MFGGLTSVGRLPGCHPFLWIDPRCLVRSSGSIHVDSTPSSGAITLSASVSLGYRSGPHWSSHFCGVDASLRIGSGIGAMFGASLLWGRLPGCHPFLWIDPR